MYLYWGYNRIAYSKSDIHFTGPDYDFTLLQVEAFDKAADFAIDPYLTATGWTFPQYNYRIGYFINDRWAISGGMDHMKYVMVKNQPSTINGEINTTDTEFNGVYDNEPIILTEEFLTFEHTDGLNYANIETEYFRNIYKFSEKHSFNAYGGGGVGLLIPKSNVQLMGYERNDVFHLAGFGLDLKAGANLTLWKYFFLQTELKVGYINMGDILTRPNDVPDRASQQFMFSQWNFVFGGYIPL